MKMTHLHEKPSAKDIPQITKIAVTTIFHADPSVLSGTIDVVIGWAVEVVVS